LRFSLTERAAGSLACPGAGGQVKAGDDALQFIKQTLYSVHSADDALNWALLGYKGTSIDEVELIGSGSGGSQELVSQLHDDIVAYGLVRIVDVVDGIPTNRYAYINWVGDRVPGARKARIATNKTSINEIIGHYSVEFVASSKEELTEEVIKNKIQDTSGSRNRVQETVKPIERNTGRGGGNRTIVPSTVASSASLCPDELKHYMADVRNDSTATNWALFSYDNLKAPKQLVFTATGNGDITELTSNLKTLKFTMGCFASQIKSMLA